MLEGIAETVWKILKHCWAKKDLRLHVVTWSFSGLLALGLYFYIGFRSDEAASAGREDGKVRTVELKDLKESVDKIDQKVDRVYDYLITGQRSHRPIYRGPAER